MTAARLAGARPARDVIAALADRLAGWAFGLLVLLSSFRLRVVLQERSIGELFHDYTDIRVDASELALLALLGLWAISLVARPRPITTGPRWFRWSGTLLLGAAWLGVPFSVDPPLATANAIAFSAYGGLALFVINEVRHPGQLVVPVVATFTAQGAVAVAQFLLQHSIGLWPLGEQVLDPFVPGASIVTSLDGQRVLRAYGLTDHPNILGGLLVFGLCIVAALLGWRATGDRPVRRRVAGGVLAAATALSILALWLTFSRGAWLALVAAAATGIAIEVLARRRAVARRWLAAAGAVALIGLALLVPLGSVFAARVDASPDRPASERRSIDERVALVGAAIRVAVAHPLLGTGVGVLPEAMAETVPDLRYPPQPAHTVLLTALAETGLPGAAGLAGLFVGPWLAWRRRRDAASASSDAAPAAALLVAIIVVGLFDYYPWTFAAGRAWTAIGLGLVAAAGRG